LGELGIGGQRPVGGHVGAQDVGQHECVPGVGFLARHRIPIPIARYRHRVDRIDVSMATGIGSSALSPASASSAIRAAKPAASSLIRRLAISVPSLSTRATSWWASAQSIPQNTLKILFLLSIVEI
jgi:hypothetical protein